MRFFDKSYKYWIYWKYLLKYSTLYLTVFKFIKQKIKK